MRLFSKYVIAAIFSWVVILFISSCGNTNDKEAAKNNVTGATEKKELPVTQIKFEEMEHDFGKIDQGQVVEYVFKFKNTGNNPLVVSEAKASCGCTIPEWTKTPVQPGQEGKIDIKYNSAGREGQIHKTVTVYANTDPEQTVLNINVEVIKKIDGPFKN